MDGSTSNGYDIGRSMDGSPNSQSGEALAEWRSCEQVDNGTPSTSPPYWDTDDDIDGGVKPSELYGRYTWKIDKFSQTSKKELKSAVFEVNNYKWYILIYPQGCDVCNHLSLFLCVANHDKLFPGWGHFAQFTIAVVNRDPKKSKYSDTLHRFWKKEHDWGWKKFMELSKVQEGFVIEDTLEIRAQVQIIREQSHRPFRCLDRQYRRELVRVYISNVEQVCLRFLEEQKGKLLKLLEDEVGWTSFCTFWLGADQNTKQCMSKENTDTIFRIIVKHFFVEKEVTSTLVMDSLYSGLKALEIESRHMKGKSKLSDSAKTSSLIVYIDDNMFILADDVMCLLQTASLESLLPNHEKCPLNRKKDGISGEDLNKDSFERDERRLTEIGRRTIEIFVLAHIFSQKIEVAYKEDVSLKRQNELIREEEAASKAEIEQKAKRQAAEREKRLRRKMRRSIRKVKDTGNEEQSDVAVKGNPREDNPVNETVEENSRMLAESLPEKPNQLGDVSDVSDIEGEAGEPLSVYGKDRDASPVNGDSDSPEACSPRSDLALQNGHEKSLSLPDENSSTGSTESVQSEDLNGSCKGKFFPQNRSQKPPTREEKEGKNMIREQIKPSVESNIQQIDVAFGTRDMNKDSKCTPAAAPELKAWLCKKDHGQWVEKHLIKKKELSSKVQVDVGNHSKQMMATEASNPEDCPSNCVSVSQFKSAPSDCPLPDTFREESSTNLCQANKDALPVKQLLQNVGTSKHVEKTMTLKPFSKLTENGTLNQELDRKSNGPAVFVVQSPSTLSATVDKQLVPKPPSATPQAHGNSTGASTIMDVPSSRTSSSEAANSSWVYSAPSAFTHSIDNSGNDLLSRVTFGSVTQEVLLNQTRLPEALLQSGSSLSCSTENLHLHDRRRVDSIDTVSAGPSVCQPQRTSLDEFPHLDIINYLFDEDLEINKAVHGSEISECLSDYSLIHQVAFPNNLGMFELPYTARQVYGSFGSHVNGVTDVFSIYGNGQFDGVIQNDWPMGYGSSIGLVEEGYPYHVPDYSNLARGVGDYPVFQLSNGH